MEKITLNNGVTMPLLGYGTYQMTDPAACAESVYTAIRTGYRLIDTAQAYGNEEAVGAGISRAIREGLVKRDDLFITTKVWFHRYETADCEKSLEESLAKLGLSYLDMVLLHWPYGNVYAAWRVLEKWQAEGRIRAIGVSNMDPDRLIDLITFNKVKPQVDQIETHLYCQRKSDRKWLDKLGITPEAYAPLGQGRANAMFAEPAVKELAVKHGKTPAQIALRFLTQSGIAAIPKTVHRERMKENLSIFDFSFTEEEMEILRTLDKVAPMIGNAEKPETAEFAMTW